MSKDETEASPFAALFEWERKNGGGGGGGGGAKNQVQAGSSGSKLRPGGRKGERRFHDGHYLANTKINNIVKAKYVKNNHDAARHIIQHIDYIQKRERDRDEPERKFYGRDGERSRDDVVESVMNNRGEQAAMFKIILSPKQNELNHIEYTAEIMRRFEEQSGIKTDWSMVEHKNTDHHHVHIVMPGKDMEGRSYRLEVEHLDLFKEIANEYQYELQGYDYQLEKQIQQEFGYTREESERLLISQRDSRDMRDLGVYRPGVDRLVRDDLLPPKNFDDVYFRQQLEKEFWSEVSQDFKNLQSELSQHMQERHPELYPGLVRQLQAEMINDAYFEMLKEFHPALHREHMNDRALDRRPVIDRLKQAFPEWYDPIVDQLKELEPKLFSGFEKPGQTERELMNNLRASNPEIFPELSRQIQEHQVDTVMMAMLATENPARMEQILSEKDPDRQKELIERTRADYSGIVDQARERLAERYPKLYRWELKEGPSETDIIRQLLKDSPELFPEATKALQKNEVDNALFEQLREASPKLASEIEFDPDKRGAAVTIMRVNFPEQLKKATEQVREEQPELFKYEREGPSEREIMQALEKEHPELYPNIMRKTKELEIDKAYFERGVEVTPDGLKAYLDNPDLDRAELYRVLRNKHPEWRDGIERELKERRPELFKFDRMYESDDERFADLRKTNPELFPGLKSQEEPQLVKELEIERSPRLQKLEQVKEHLVDRAYFDKGREDMADGLIEYLEHADYDRKYIVDGLKLSRPDWEQEINSKLREQHPQLFAEIAKEESKARLEAQERATAQERMAGEHTSDRFSQEATLLLALAYDKDPLAKPEHEKFRDGELTLEREDQERDELDEEGRELDESEKADHLLADAKDAILAAENIRTGKEWSGLMSFDNPGFVDEPIDLTAEAQALYASQMDINKQLNEFESDVMQLDPNMLLLQDTVDDVTKDLDDIDKEDDSDRGF